MRCHSYAALFGEREVSVRREKRIGCERLLYLILIING
jgi:hypothetical protein